LDKHGFPIFKTVVGSDDGRNLIRIRRRREWYDLSHCCAPFRSRAGASSLIQKFLEESFELERLANRAI
jgi:hypothetical protein